MTDLWWCSLAPIEGKYGNSVANFSIWDFLLRRCCYRMIMFIFGGKLNAFRRHTVIIEAWQLNVLNLESLNDSSRPISVNHDSRQLSLGA